MKHGRSSSDQKKLEIEETLLVIKFAHPYELLQKQLGYSEPYTDFKVEHYFWKLTTKNPRCKRRARTKKGIQQINN